MLSHGSSSRISSYTVRATLQPKSNKTHQLAGQASAVSSPAGSGTKTSAQIDFYVICGLEIVSAVRWGVANPNVEKPCLKNFEQQFKKWM